MGHLSMLDKMDTKNQKYVVYDIDAFSYATILDIFATQPTPNVSMAFYNPYTKTILTAEEVISWK